MTTAARQPKKATAKKKAVKKVADTSVGVRELRQSASKLLDRVKAGSVVEITEHGVPIARLVPITKSLYEEYVEAGLIIPAANPTTRFEMPTFRLKGKKTSTEVLADLRAGERY